MASINRARYSWKRKKGQPDASPADYAISIRMQPDKVESYDYSIDVGEQKSDPDPQILRTRAPNILPCRPCRPSIVLQDNAHG